MFILEGENAYWFADVEIPVAFRASAVLSFLAIVSPIVALALRDPTLLEFGDFSLGLSPAYEYALLTAFCAIPAFILFRIDEGMSRFFSVHDVLAACSAVALAIASSSAIAFVLNRLDGVPRSTPLICGLVMTAGLLFARTGARAYFRVKWAADAPAARPAHLRRVLFVGVDRFAAIAIKLIHAQLPRTTTVVAALDPRPAFAGRNIFGAKVVGLPGDLEAVIEEYAVHGVDINEVWYSENLGALSPAEILRLSEQCGVRGLRFVGLAEALNLTPPAAPATLLREEDAPFRLSAYFEVKRALDVIAASALLIALAPAALVVAVLTRIDVGAPALFWQQRIGRQGRRFLLYKFRTYQAPFLDSCGARPTRVGCRKSAAPSGRRASTNCRSC